jgi:hypothetical protein
LKAAESLVAAGFLQGLNPVGRIGNSAVPCVPKTASISTHAPALTLLLLLAYMHTDQGLTHKVAVPLHCKLEGPEGRLVGGVARPAAHEQQQQQQPQQQQPHKGVL